MDESDRYRHDGPLAKGEFVSIEPPDFMKAAIAKGRGEALSDIEARAGQALAALGDDYLAKAGEDLRRIEAALAQLSGGAAERQAALERVHRIAHDMRGQAGTFGYDLITTIGSSLCDYIEEAEDPARLDPEALQIHVDSLRAVLKGRVTGDGGKLGRELLAGVQALVEKALGAD